MQASKKIYFTGIIVISLGITFSTTMADELGSLGVIFIAIGALLLMSGIARKKEENKAKQ